MKGKKAEGTKINVGGNGLRQGVGGGGKEIWSSRERDRRGIISFIQNVWHRTRPTDPCGPATRRAWTRRANVTSPTFPSPNPILTSFQLVLVKIKSMVHYRLNESEPNPNPHINFITALPTEDPAEQERARQLLRALAAQVKPVMKAHGFVVNSLEEVRLSLVLRFYLWY